MPFLDKVYEAYDIHQADDGPYPECVGSLAPDRKQDDNTIGAPVEGNRPQLLIHVGVIGRKGSYQESDDSDGAKYALDELLLPPSYVFRVASGAATAFPPVYLRFLRSYYAFPLPFAVLRF